MSRHVIGLVLVHAGLAALPLRVNAQDGEASATFEPSAKESVPA